jgi:uncharacterized protein YbdZ (MbtH family)
MSPKAPPAQSGNVMGRHQEALGAFMFGGKMQSSIWKPEIPTGWEEVTSGKMVMADLYWQDARWHQFDKEEHPIPIEDLRSMLGIRVARMPQ